MSEKAIPARTRPGRYDWRALGRPQVYVPLLGFLLVLLAPTYISSSYGRHVLILVVMYAALGLAWNIIGGYGGQFSLGHAAFFGVGAYTSTMLLHFLDVSPWIGMILGGLLAMLVSLLIGLTCFRLRSHYFTIATIAFGEVFRLLALFFRQYTGGAQGMTVPYLGDAPLMYQFRGKVPYFYITLVLLLAVVYATHRIRSSRLGYYLLAIGQNQDAAEAVGAPVVASKQQALLVSAFFSALLGTFYAQYVYFIEPISVFSLDYSILIALIAIVGGVATLAGPILGALIIIPVRELSMQVLGSSLPGGHLILYGLILVVVILLRPSGLISLVERWYTWLLRFLPGGRRETADAQ